MPVRLVACALLAAAGLVAWASVAEATPNPVTAWYMYGSSASDLRSYAYARGCDFARAQPGGTLRVLLLDFGAARKVDSSTSGAVDFSNTRFSNADILAALERASDGYHNCHVRGSVDIAYGNSNYHLAVSGMSGTDAWNAGYRQSATSEDLHAYQEANGYTSQTSDAASDMEPSWESSSITRQLVNGDQAQGWAVYFDFGSADGCPQSGSADGPCNNGWHVSDVGYASYGGLAVPLPEIYYTA
ncbi:MAG TPA: hypothetical protein VKB70_00430, partial [Gaiellaceae bacterium]|nr:hypothetical protein [Gaiellaceae bacterium]